MFILHAAFDENRLFVWGEIPAPPNPPVHRGSKSRLKAAKPPLLPYDAGKEHLLKALQEAGLDQLLKGKRKRGFGLPANGSGHTATV